MARRPNRTKADAVAGNWLVFILVALFLIGSVVASPVAVVLLVILAVVVVWRLLRRPRLATPAAQDLMAGFSQVSAMTGGQFEVFIAEILRKTGHDVTVLGGSGDQGVDIIVTAGPQQKIAVQCKNYRKAIGNKPVQEVYAGAMHHRCQHAWVVAPAGYTKGAYELASSVGVLLFDGEAMKQWIKMADEEEKKTSAQRKPV